MSSFTLFSQACQQPTLFGRGGYNGPNEDEEDKATCSPPLINQGRDGYNKSSSNKDDEGRGGYN
jgi:hypothetical protein